jgi:hypothetical protein
MVVNRHIHATAALFRAKEPSVKMNELKAAKVPEALWRKETTSALPGIKPRFLSRPA